MAGTTGVPVFHSCSRQENRYVIARSALLLMSASLLAGCGVNPFNLSSLPGAPKVEVRNEATHAFLKTSGPGQVDSLGLNMDLRDAAADGEVVGLAVSGGGMRASAFTLGVLEGLEELQLGADSRNVLDRVDFISAISGGSWAVAAYLADRADKPGGSLKANHSKIVQRFAETETIKVSCWANGMIGSVTLEKTFNDIYSGDNGATLPQVFFGSSLYPSQSPFVFTADFLRHYEVSELGDYCVPNRLKLPPEPEGDFGLGQVPIGYAASASGTVPAFTSAFARTRLCEGNRYSFCNTKKARKSADTIQLVDGGVYDNLGYKVAFERLMSLRRQKGKLPPATMVLIDSGTEELDQTVRYSRRNNSNLLGYAAATSFSNQDATYARLARTQFEAVGLRPENVVLIDFGSLAGFDPQEHPDALDGLALLADFAARGVRCTGDDGQPVKAPNRLERPVEVPAVEDSLNTLREKGEDCLRMNFVRAGYLHKTTYKYDEYAFALRYQLGKFAVRVHRSKLAAALARTP